MLLPDYLSLHILKAIVVLSVTWILLFLWKKFQNLPPGPWGIPYFGYYPFLATQSHVDFANLAKKYGNLFCFRSVGGKLFVILNGQKLIKEILVHRSDEFIGRPIESNLLEWISDGLGVTQEEGPSWKEHRRYFLQTVKNFGFGKMEIEGTIHEEIKILKEDLLKAQGQPTDIGFHVTYAVNSVIVQVMFARKFEKYGPIFPKLAKAANDLIAVFADRRFMLVGLPFRFSLQYLPWGEDVREGRRFLKTVVQDIIEDHIRSFDPNNIRDYVDSYLLEMKNLKEKGKLEESTFTMERLLGISMNMTMEGTDSVGDTLCSLLTEAAKHPEEQKKVQEEMDSVIGRERLPSMLDKPKLPYLEAFIQELFRIAQAFYNTTHYSNFEETTIRGYRIPKRSIIVGNLWSINNDPEIYPNPSKFDPTRFLERNGEKLNSDGPYPFSMGKRDCVGKSLAKMEVFLVVASVLQNFTLQPGDKYGFVRAIPRN
ncbi:cytochrome P450 2J1-like [Argiope bruennichi]|uniref:cytochrome P450 2J1-like n=1 Tax=Argiope bruennichi TaxID=94029 RepID=UPI00249475A7|nr:cytochrome P450 2J1-like [Argiope bruennichi]